MGQYWIPVNMDKREFISPHKLGCGLKLVEQLWNRGVGEALILLQTAPAAVGRGGGDFDPAVSPEVIGRWAGDRVMLISDYTYNGDGYPNPKAKDPPIGEVYGLCNDFDPHYYYKDKPEPQKTDWNEVLKQAEPFGGLFTDISESVAQCIEHHCNVIYVGRGWRQRVERDAFKHAGYDLSKKSVEKKVRELSYAEVRDITEKYEKYLRQQAES